MTLIGLSGYARSGKDTAAGALTERGFTRVAFADRMRAAVLALDPYVIDGYGQSVRLSMVIRREGWERSKVVYPEVRRLLQKFGTEAGREIHGSECWVDAAFRELDLTTDVVFTDVRFGNEAAAIKERGGEVWRIERPGTGPVTAHPSETALDGFAFDRVIRNDGTVDELHMAVCVALAPGKAASPPPLKKPPVKRKK